MKKIKQIITAPVGLMAVYKGSDGVTPVPVCCLALTENECGEQTIEGVDASGEFFDFCEDADNFQRYSMRENNPA